MSTDEELVNLKGDAGRARDAVLGAFDRLAEATLSKGMTWGQIRDLVNRMGTAKDGLDRVIDQLDEMITKLDARAEKGDEI